MTLQRVNDDNLVVATDRLLTIFLARLSETFISLSISKMALVEILRKFSFEPSERTPEPLPVRNKGLTLTVRGDDLWLKVVRR